MVLYKVDIVIYNLVLTIVVCLLGLRLFLKCFCRVRAV